MQVFNLQSIQDMKQKINLSYRPKYTKFISYFDNWQPYCKLLCELSDIVILSTLQCVILYNTVILYITL